LTITLVAIDVRVLFEHVLHELFGLPGGGAIADGDQLDVVLPAQVHQHRLGLRGFRPGDGGEYGAVVQHLAGGVHHRQLDPGAQARVQADGGFLAGRGRQQQILQISGEHLDGIGFGFFPQLGQQVGFQAREQLHPPGPVHHLRQPGVRRAPLVVNPPVLPHHDLARVDAALAVLVRQCQGQVEHALVAATEHGQRPVGGRVLQRLVVLEVVAEFLHRMGVVVGLAPRRPGAQARLALQEAAQPVEQRRVLAELLHQDEAGAFQGAAVSVIFMLGVEVFCRLGLRVQARVCQQGFRQRFQARLPGDLAFGAPPGLVRQVQILEPGLGVRLPDVPLQLRSQLVLSGDAFEDGAAAVLQLAQVAQALFQGAHRGIVQAPGRFLAVAGDERHGGAFVQQGHRGRHLLLAAAELFGNSLGYRDHRELRPAMNYRGRYDTHSGPGRKQPWRGIQPGARSRGARPSFGFDCSARAPV
jgi:hypothetical protein